MPLKELEAKNAKPKDKPYKLTDEKALYLEVMPGGAMWQWVKPITQARVSRP